MFFLFTFLALSLPIEWDWLPVPYLSELPDWSGPYDHQHSFAVC